MDPMGLITSVDVDLKASIVKVKELFELTHRTPHFLFALCLKICFRRGFEETTINHPEPLESRKGSKLKPI